MGFVFKRFNVAPGEDATDELIPLWQYGDQTCRPFARYKHYLEIKWYDDEGRELSGDDRLKPVGLPNVRIILSILTTDEFQILKETIMQGELRDSPVTAHLPCLSENRWANYNGLMELPEKISEKFVGVGTEGEYRDTEWVISNLIEIISA